MAFIELFEKVKLGDRQAIEDLLRMYRPLLLKESIINGTLNDDLYQELCIVFLRCIKRFEL